MSDHFPKCMVHSTGGPTIKKSHHTSIKYRCQKNFEPENFIKDLRELPWSVLDSYDDTEDALDIWTSLIESIVNEHLPWREKRVKHVKQPEWIKRK